MNKIQIGKVKKYICIGLACMTAVVTSGCVKFEEPKDTDLYVEYAANAILKHDKNYIDRMKEVYTTEEETQAQTSEEETTTAGNMDPSSNDITGEGSQNIAMASMNEIFSLNGFDIQPAGYEIVDSYPHNGSELGMSMIAVNGYKLLVMKLNVTNTASTEQALNMISMDAKYKAVVNDTIKMNVQVTALLDAFNTWNGSFAAGEMKQLVLVFQISDSNAAEVQSVKLNASCADRQGIVNIQ